MCTVCGGVAGLNIADHTLTSVTRPACRSNPRGWFIQALAVTTKKAEATPATTMGRPDSRCVRGGSRSQP